MYRKHSRVHSTVHACPFLLGTLKKVLGPETGEIPTIHLQVHLQMRPFRSKFHRLTPPQFDWHAAPTDVSIRCLHLSPWIDWCCYILSVDQMSSPFTLD